MKALITEYRVTRAIVFASLLVTAYMLDTRFSRGTAALTGVLLSLVYWIIGNDDPPGMTAFKTGYVMVTVVLDTPWTIATAAFIVLEIIRFHKERRERPNGKD